MPIQLDKILADISEENALHPFSVAAKDKKAQEDAWCRVGKKNKLSAHEAKSIFKVLQKKYEQENLKPSSTWKLYQQMEGILKKEEMKPKLEPEESAEPEEESFVEFLEVREEDEDYDGESDNQDKSMKSLSPRESPEKEASDSKPDLKVLNSLTQSTTNVDHSSSTQQQQKQATAFTNEIQKKGISIRKTLQHPPYKKIISKVTEPARSVLLPESIKRKLQNVDQEDMPVKKSVSLSTNNAQLATSTNQFPSIEIKQEAIEDIEASVTTTASREGINVITIAPTNSTGNANLPNGITAIKTNCLQTRIEDFDFQKDIIFDSNPTSKQSNAPGEIINIGNFENQLPPTFFKNLCNSNRHEALGLYLANVMNRVSPKVAAKLEIDILKSIIEAKSDELSKL